MLGKTKKIAYLLTIGFLTSTAATAAYWQTNRYFQSRARWTLIANQLSKKQPDSLASLNQSQLFPLKYVKAEATVTDKVMLISRARQGRIGNLVVRALQFGQEGNKKVILAVEGWIPEDFEYHPKKQHRKFLGILREKQKTDYLHKKMKQTDIQKFNINTYIDVQKSIQQLQIQNKQIIKDYYFQILRDPNQHEHEDGNHYPYKYSVDNFQLPYLTPDKHRAYAMFWTLTTFVGLTAIRKVYKMK